MITTLIVTACFLFCVWSISRSEAAVDAWKIKENRTINHAKEWTERAAIVTFGVLVCMIWLKWHALLLLPVGAGSFSAWFRYRLNKLRGKPWWYVSPSNHYDTAFLIVAGKNIQRAGRIAYITEVTIAAYCVVALILNA